MKKTICKRDILFVFLALIVQSCAVKISEPQSAKVSEPTIVQSTTVNGQGESENTQSPSSLISNKIFKRSLVFSGGGFSLPMYIGAYDALVESGYNPDLIVGTCGSSMSVSLIDIFPDRAQRLEYLKSKEFQQLLLIPSGNMGVLNGGLSGLWNMTQDSDNPEILNFFEDTILTRPALSPDSVFRLAMNPNRDHSTMIIAARTRLQPTDVGGKFEQGQKYFEHVVFTDYRTAGWVSRKVNESPTAKRFPESRVSSDLVYLSDRTYEEATRASTAEPFLFEPESSTDGYYYLGSYIDLYPADFVHPISDEIIAIYPNLPDGPTEGSIQLTYGFSPQTRAKEYAASTNVTRWIDFSDKSDFEDKFGMPYKKGLTLSGGIGMKNTVPTKLNEFQKRIQSLYDYGFERAKEAMLKEARTQEHIRKPLKN